MSAVLEIGVTPSHTLFPNTQHPFASPGFNNSSPLPTNYSALFQTNAFKRRVLPPPDAHNRHITMLSMLLHCLLHIPSYLFIASPFDTWTAFIVLFVARIVTFSLILRTYVAPWALAQVSRHIRVRSISLRSIRGIYFRKGRITCRIERIVISFHSSRFEGSSRLSLRVEGFDLNVDSEGAASNPPTPSSPENGAPLACKEIPWLEGVVWRVVYTLEPFVRPAARIMTLFFIRTVINWLPFITQMLELTFISPTVSFPDFLGARITAEELYLHCTLGFTQMETIPTVEASLAAPGLTSTKYGIAVWRQKVSGSLNRHWNRAWGQVIASGKTEFRASKIVATIVSLDNLLPSTALAFPGSINSEIALRFSPGLKEIVKHSVEANLNLSEFHAVAGNLLVVADTWKSRQVSKNEGTKTIPGAMSLADIPECSSPVGMEQHVPLVNVKKQPPPPRRSRMSRLSTRLSRNSQFFETLSASMLPSSRTKSANPKPEDVPKFRLDFLLSVRIGLSKCVITDSATHPKKEHWREAVFRDISAFAGRRLNTHQEHTRWIGRPGSDQHSDDSEHEFRFSISSMVVDRKQLQDHLRLVNLSGLSLNMHASHWPTPWISPDRLLSGDPNSRLVVINASIKEVHLTERLDVLAKFTKNLPSHSPRSPLSTTPKSAARFFQHTPRIILEAACGPIKASLICPDALPDGESLLAELRADGLVFSTSSYFTNLPKPLAQQLANLQHNAISMEYTIEGHVSPTFLRVRTQQYTYNETSSLEDLDDPLLASCDFIELSGSGTMVGHIDETRGRNVMDPAAGILSLHTSSDFVCVELWHKSVIALVQGIVSSSEPHQPTPSQIEKQPVSPRLLKGIDLSLSVGRVVGFVTAPDVNPKQSLDMSRGIAARAAISIQYSCLRPAQIFFFQHLLGRSENRHKLSLPEEPSLNALNFAKSRDPTREPAAFMNVIVRNAVLRGALATQYSPDDPDMAEKDSFGLQETEIIRLDRIDLDCRLGILGFTPEESCEISAQFSQAILTFRMLDVYSATLALQTLRGLVPKKRTSDTPHPRRSLAVSIRMRFKTAEAMVYLPHKDLQVELHDVECRSGLGQMVLDWSLLCINVIVPRTDRWLEVKEDRWEELGSIQRGHVTVHADSQRPIAVKAASLRLRIPSGYVFSDLVLDLSVIFKASRHLMLSIPTKTLEPMPTPPSEDAKTVPSISFNIDTASVEAADDEFEAHLGLIWQAGLEAAKIREDREQAFSLKVASIAASGETSPSSYTDQPGHTDEYEFGPKHTVSIHEARQRLDQVHYMDWKYRLESFRQRRAEAEQTVLDEFSQSYGKTFKRFQRRIRVHTHAPVPPLFRALIQHLAVTISPPTFPPDQLPQFLHDKRNGMPLDTAFSLLVPMHLQVKLASLCVSLRDYPLPLLNVPPSMSKDSFTWSFSTNLVIAEEMGTDASVHWVPLTIVDERGPGGQSKLVLDVPKTIMPVKTYADAEVFLSTPGITTISWGVSYQPATQDLMRVLDNLTSPPRDNSPALGFWDKLRLICHWRIKANFSNDVRFHMKGSRNPYETNGAGAGLALSWQGSPVLTVGHENENRELIQVLSQSMLVIVPRLDEKSLFRILCGPTDSDDGLQKVCATFSSGVCFGVGFFLERTCGLVASCDCSGSSFDRACRSFNFAPHHSVVLEKKAVPPLLGSLDDSYRDFRSDFVHLSISLSSSLNKKTGAVLCPSSLHLTPNVFMHFWSWWSLFESVLSLPIRQGTYYPQKHVSPKFGRHLATIKYRLMVSKLFLFHAYVENNQDTWADGVTPFVGIKAFVEEFHADMHQREEETIIPGSDINNPQKSRRKPFYAAEVVLQGLDLRAMSAVVEEKGKKSIPVSALGQPSNFRARGQGSPSSLPAGWLDNNDFVDVNWRPPRSPIVTYIPVVTCPRFTYVKQTPASKQSTSKFGHECSHECLIGKEKSVTQIQLSLVEERLKQLQLELLKQKISNGDDDRINLSIEILQEHAERLRKLDNTASGTAASEAQNHYMSPNVSPAEDWAEFDNVYQAHCPQIYLDRPVRDILIQYYYCSRSRRGLEYHMAARAVKFIRDQADAAIHASTGEQDKNLATQAAEAFRRILSGEHTRPSREEFSPPLGTADPLDGWSEGVLLEKRHFGLLLKPQVVLKSEGTIKALCAIAATEVRLQGFTILDETNKDDPVSGKIMTRTFAKATELQTFAPASPDYTGDGHLPLEIFADDKCDCLEFDRLVPQTTATLQYDKFNRLRLRNNVTAVRKPKTKAVTSRNNHLYNQTDLIDIYVPQLTVIANDRHFQYISHIVTKLVLFSDPAHKTRMNKLETLLFQYDFTDLANAADVVTRLQSRIRAVKEELAWLETQRDADEDFDETEYHALGANAFVLYDELNTIFDTIKLAQDQADDRSDQKSALLLHTTSSEISWRMLERDASLAKLAVRNPHFHWLSRQDGSMENTVTIGDLQAFDTSPDALWVEILAKYEEATGHPMLKSGLFASAEWTVLAPVGGITIYEKFKVEFHPMRIQIDARLGTRILEYLWPGRKERRLAADPNSNSNQEQDSPPITKITRASVDSPTNLHALATPELKDSDQGLAPPSLRRLGVSRSFTDLRSAAAEFRPQIKRTRSISPMTSGDEVDDVYAEQRPVVRFTHSGKRVVEGAAVMKTRASQKTFVHVQISSLHLLLSIVKEQSFECHNARIRTRELEYHNETLTFEEMVNRFIPSDLSWKGWVKMAFNQPLLPVLPVARELLSKTKFINTHKANRDGHSPPSGPFFKKKRHSHSSSGDQGRKTSTNGSDLTHITSHPFVDEPEEEDEITLRRPSRPRMISLFSRNPRKSSDTSRQDTVRPSGRSLDRPRLSQ